MNIRAEIPSDYAETTAADVANDVSMMPEDSDTDPVMEADIEPVEPKQSVVTTVARADLARAVAVAARVAEKRACIPVLCNVRVVATDGGLKLTGTDLDIEMNAVIPAVADADFAMTVPAHTLSAALKKAKACESIGVLVDHNAGTAKFNFDGLNITLHALPTADFPEPDWGIVTHSFPLLTADLLRALDRTFFAVSTEETRYYLNGVYMYVRRGRLNEPDMLTFVSTDGHKLGHVEIPCPAGIELMPGCIIPRKTVWELLALSKAKGAPDTVTVNVATKAQDASKAEVDEYDGISRAPVSDIVPKLSFRFGDITVNTKTIDGTFPDYTRVVPLGNDKRMAVNRAKLIEAIQQVTVLSSERGRAVKFSLEADRLRLSVSNPDSGAADTDIACDFQSPPMDVGYNAGYVVGILEHIDSESVEFMLADPGSPILIRGIGDEERDTYFVLMPMRV